MQIQSLDELSTEKEIKLFGKTTAQKFLGMKIFFIGLKSLGMEIAKHIIQQQPEKVTLCDPQAQNQEKLLRSINQVTVIKSVDLNYKDEEVLRIAALHDLTVICDIHSLKLARTISKHLREINQQNKRYSQGVLWAATFGFTCLAFTDYGEGFKVFDRDGETPFPYHIRNITNGQPGVVTLDQSIPHNYQTGDFVCIHEVEGMIEVNGNEPRPIKILSGTSFSIEDTTHFRKYQCGGLVQLAKVPQKFKFKTLEETIKHPQIKKSSENMTVYATLISVLNQLDNEQPIEEYEILVLVRDLFKEANEDLVKKTLRQINQTWFPVVNFWSGICSIEIIKFTGKFTPQQCQFVQFISDVNINEENLKEKLSKQNLLVVGCGGTGCEIIRQLAIMECCNVPDYKVTILDDDIVRKYTTLSHFWFKTNQIGMLKAKVAQEQSWQICQNMNVDLQPQKFTNNCEGFIQAHQMIFSASNNQTARVLIAQLAEKHNKIVFDQTLIGLKAAAQLGIGNKKINLEDSLKSVYNVDKETYKYFPYLPLHCVLWAKDVFENSFVGFVNDFRKYLEDPQQYVSQCDDQRRLRAHVISRICKPGFNLSLDKILSLSKELFEFHFELKINELLKNYPDDGLNNVWVGYRKAPTPLKFSSNDPDHVTYVQITSILISKLFGLNSTQAFKPEFVIDKLNQMNDNYWSLHKAEVELHPLNGGEKPTPQHLNFDEDQTRGLYVRCIHSLSTLRAKNYGIKGLPMHKVQKHALDIHRSNPMMHSMIVGWMGIELLKIIFGSNCQHRNMHVDVNRQILEFV